MKYTVMKSLFVVLLVASIASLEFFHELSGGDTSGAAACMAPQSKQDLINDLFLQHLQSH